MKKFTISLKSFKRSILALAILSACNLYAQPQLKKWYFNGEGVNFTTPAPSVFTMPGPALAGAESAANGIYDAAGNLLFYVLDNELYDKFGAFIEEFEPFFIGMDRMGPATIIVPVPGSCTKYYCIYLDIETGPLLFLQADLRYSEFDITLNGNTGGITPGKKHVYVTSLYLEAVGSIAVSKLLPNNTRNVYFVGSEAYTSGSVIKSELNSTGIVSPTVIYSTTTANDFSTSQVVISRDQKMLAFASLKKNIGTPVNDVTLIHLDPLTGNINTNLGTMGITGYNLPGIIDQAYSGIEFSPDNTKLLVGAVAIGVYWIDIASSAVSSNIITGTDIPDYGSSQLGVAYNGLIYAATSPNNLKAIDPFQTPPVLAATTFDVNFTTNAVISNAHTAYTFNNPAIFTLPALVDGAEINILDLYTKDVPADNGEKPDPQGGGIMWISDDIWVRNQQDGFVNQFHENPIYIGNPVYAYVRVRNLSCVDFISTSSDLLHAYWAKAATALAWPANWDGSLPPCGGNPNAPFGGELSPPQQIPNIPAGGDVILEFTWNLTDPSLYTVCGNPEPWHFCLLSRIDSPKDPMTFPEIPSIWDNVKNNNNIAWKNITVVDLLLAPPPTTDCYSDRQVGGVIAVGNPFNVGDDNYKLEFKIDDNYTGKPITEQAEIKITLDDRSWEIWAAGGYQQENLRIKREDCHQLVVTGSPAALKNLRYASMERSTMNLSFNFLTDKVDATPEFDYHVIQTRSTDDKIIGGELYQIRKPSRYLFGANAGGDKAIDKNDSVQLSAQTIGEDAYYNWYDTEGNLIYSGSDFTVSPEITTKYKLEIIALSDGFASHDSLTVNVSDCEIETISPNPATNQVTVEYKLLNASSAYLTISQQGGASNNYILNTAVTTTTINVSNYTPGSYNVLLICDGVVKDQKTLVIL